MKVKIRENRGVVIFDLKGRIIGPDGAKLRKLIVEQVPADVAPKLTCSMLRRWTVVGWVQWSVDVISSHIKADGLVSSTLADKSGTCW